MPGGRDAGRGRLARVTTPALHVGLDLAWSTGVTGLAVVDDAGRLLGSGSCRTDDEIAAWLDRLDAPVAVVGVDAPLVVPNATGQREAERAIGRAFGRYGASAHTANRGTFGGADPRAWRLAERFGWATDPGTPVGGGRTLCLEVYPHPALVALFGLPYRLDYKKGPRERRQPGFAALVAHLESVPGLRAAESPRWAHLRGVVADPGPGDLDRVEDELDAVVCAHLAWLWHHRPGSLEVYGSAAGGYVVAPPAPAHPAVRPPRAAPAPRSVRAPRPATAGHDARRRPEVVCLCGSVRFADEMRAANRDLTAAGAIVVAPGEAPEPLTDEQRAALGQLHLRRIDLADRVLVVNPGGYVGESTTREIAYARAAGKPVAFTEPG